MSIYMTLGTLMVDTGELDANGDEMYARVWFQAVPGHIRYEGRGWDEYLTPSIPEDDGIRTVFVVDDAAGTTGQRYDRYLLRLSGEEYRTVGFLDLWMRLEAAVAKAHGGEG